MAKSDNSFVTWGLLAVGGYFAYEWFFKPAAAASPATSAPGASPSPGGTANAGTPALPAPTQPTGGGGTMMPPPSGITPVDPNEVLQYQQQVAQQSPGGTSPGTVTRTIAQTMDALYQKLKSTIVGYQDPAISGSGDSMKASPYVFSTYLNIVAGNPSINFAQAFPGLDLNQPVTIAQFWAGVAPQLSSKGAAGNLSGLGLFAGLGALVRGAY